MHIQRAFVLALTAPVATAIVIERGAYNRTVDCLVTLGLWGGCCLSIDPVTQFGVSCLNATLAASNVGGSTFGTENQYACLNNGTTSIPTCCKFEYYWSPTYVLEKEMVCTVPGDAV